MKERKLNSNNHSGTNGVCFDGQYKKWVAYVSLGLGRQKKIGRFDSLKDAVQARASFMEDMATC